MLAAFLIQNQRRRGCAGRFAAHAGKHHHHVLQAVLLTDDVKLCFDRGGMELAANGVGSEINQLFRRWCALQGHCASDIRCLSYWLKGSE